MQAPPWFLLLCALTTLPLRAPCAGGFLRPELGEGEWVENGRVQLRAGWGSVSGANTPLQLSGPSGGFQLRAIPPPGFRLAPAELTPEGGWGRQPVRGIRRVCACRHAAGQGGPASPADGFGPGSLGMWWRQCTLSPAWGSRSSGPLPGAACCVGVSRGCLAVARSLVSCDHTTGVAAPRESLGDPCPSRAPLGRHCPSATRPPPLFLRDSVPGGPQSRAGTDGYGCWRTQAEGQLPASGRA